ncbi:PAS domain-containing protein [Shimia sp.]
MQDVKKYWDGLSDGHPVPLRSDVDPRSIQKVLKHAFILERIAPGMARLRVSCNTLTDVMGMDMRGMPMSSMINDASRDSFAEAMERVFDAPAIGRLELVSSRSFGRTGLHAEMMLLPLRSDSGQVDRILGAITCEGGPLKAPHRFDVEGSFLRRIDMPGNEKPLLQNAVMRPQKVELTAPLANSQMRKQSEPSDAPRLIPTRHPHLRVVVSGA